MFEVYLNDVLLKEFIRDDEISLNKKSAQRKLNPSRDKPKKYHLIHSKPP